MVGVSSIIAAIIIIGVVGWFIYNQNTDSDSDSMISKSQPEAQEQKQEQQEASRGDTTIIQVDISMITEADLVKLPDNTPAGFKALMTELLKDNRPDPVSGCTFTYNVNTFSQVNIAGGYSPSGESDCINGGAPILWVANPDGTWESAGGNGVDCKTKNGGLVYVEFAENCHINDGGSFIKNPNGSIKSLAE
jgi:hypothetical protein